MSIRDLSVEYVSRLTLKPYPKNPRTHTKKQIRQIAKSIETYGWTNPILIDDTGGVIAGHGRLAGAEFLGLDQIPVIRISDMTTVQKRAYVIADNRLAEVAEWDEDVLAMEIEDLINLNLDFDVTTVGFDMPEIDLLLQGLDDPDVQDAADRLPEPADESSPVSEPGDVWLLGSHRLMCGDALREKDYLRLMSNERAEMVFSDPPYNVPIDGHVSGLGKTKHREFAMASGEMTEDEFEDFLAVSTALTMNACQNGAVLYLFMDWRHIDVLLFVGKALGLSQLNLCVWNKTNGGMGSLYRSKHELVAVFKYGNARHINNVDLGRHGRYRSNVWDYAGANSFSADRAATLAMHPTVKPVSLVADALLDCSNRTGVILDPFAGSGTTIIAAENTGRRCYAMEINPVFVDVALRRYREFTGEDPIHEDTGLPFSVLQ